MSKTLWICLHHKADIKGRSELEKHMKENTGCVFEGDLDDE